MQTAHKKTEDHCITYQNVLDAAEKIEGIVHRTPVLTSSSLNESSYDNSKKNRRLFFKIEAMQRTGSFKFRGALNATLHLVDEIIASASCTAEDKQGMQEQQRLNPKVHVVTHSSGNHAAAVALAARLASEKMGMDIHATIVMPKNAPTIKVNGVLGFGGDIVFVESTNEAREEMADTIVREKGAKFIHPSEDPRVIAAQGTTCLEFVEQVRAMIKADLDAVIIPVGGGGLAAGNTVALRGLLGGKVKVRANLWWVLGCSLKLTLFFNIDLYLICEWILLSINRLYLQSHLKWTMPSAAWTQGSCLDMIRTTN